MIVFEGEVRILRSDPETLAADIQAVTELLESRRALRAAPKNTSSRDRDRRLRLAQ